MSASTDGDGEGRFPSSDLPLLPGLLPTTVRTAERRDDPPELELHPAELPHVADAVENRRREFATVRTCARAALAEYGLADVALPPGADRAPSWPAGFVGSMTHCDGFRGAAVARDTDVVAVGIDAEPDLPLPHELRTMIASPEELSALARLEGRGSERPVCWTRLLFSCKESVFKAWYPLTRTWLEFGDADVRIDPEGRTYTAKIRAPGGLTAPPTHFRGTWTARTGLIVTATVVVPPRSP